MTTVADATAVAEEQARHARVLTALAQAANRLLGAGRIENGIDAVLQRMGEALEADRLRLSAVDGGASGFDWCAGERGCAAIALDAPERWLRELRHGGAVSGRTCDFPDNEREALQAAGVRAVAALPVFVDGALWGAICIEDHRRERVWRKDELDALRTVSELLGAALARERAERELTRSEGQFRLLAEHTSDMILLGDPEGRILYASPSVRQTLGHRPEDLLGRRAQELHHPDDLSRVEADFELRPPASLPDRTLVHRLRHRDGRWLWVEARVSLVTDAEGRVLRWVASIRDISERRLMEQQLAAERERAMATLHSIADGVIAVNRDGGVDYLNPAAERCCGWELAQAREQPVVEVFDVAVHERAPGPDAGIEELTAWYRACSDGPVPVRVRGGGGERMVQLSVAPIHGAEGQSQGLVLTFRDTSQTAALMRELAYRASHDSLTGLFNREEFDRQLRRLVVDSAGNGAAHALCYIDLDQFKLVNDTCGHAAGDALLKDVASTLRSHLEEGDVLARLGGDEFGVLMPHRGAWEAARRAQDLLDALARLRFSWNERQFSIGGSVGVASVTRESGDQEAVMMSADAACYVAKERGRNRVHVFEPSDVEVARRQGEMRWIPRLQTALEVGDFHLQAHDIVPTGAGAPDGRHLEVLIALPGASGRMIPPGEFLPAAQRYGLMGRIDRWVVSQVAEWLFRREHRGAPPLELVAVNLSGSSLSDPDFREFVEEQVRALRKPEWICFEITESEAIANLNEASEFIRRMKELGCRFALDDFGSGLSSFAYLKRLPVDFIKIDGQFVRDMVHDRTNRAMVEGIHRVGKVMGLKTVAEFVETQAIYEEVRDVGVDFCQGFHFGLPRPLSSTE